MDGFTACEEIRKSPGGDAVPIVLLTGLDDIDSINRAYGVGATDFINKPFNGVLLGHRVRYILRANHAFQDLRRHESQLEQAQRIAKLGNWSWDPEADIMSCSEEFYRVRGVSKDDFDPSIESFIRRVHQEARNLVKHSFELAREEQKPFDIEHRLVRPNGSEVVVHSQTEVTTDDSAKRVLVRGTTQDISELKRKE